MKLGANNAALYGNFWVGGGTEMPVAKSLVVEVGIGRFTAAL